MSASQSALSGIRILDLTDELGVYGAKLLAELGADVIRIEQPAGDPMRDKAPKLPSSPPGTGSYFYAYMNSSKRAISLDPAHEDGRKILLRLIQTADALMVSGRRSALDRVVPGWEELEQVNPRLVLTRITPFGEDGPWSEYHYSDLILMAAGGLLSLAGDPDAEPLVAAGEQAYFITGLHAATATLIALYHAQVTGEGQVVSISAQECIVTCLENAIQYYDLQGVVRRRQGTGPREAGTGLFPCRDGYVYVMAGRLSTPRGWQALVEWMVEAGTPGAEELTRPEWSEYSHRTRPESEAFFRRVLTAFAADRTKMELTNEGQRRGIVVCPVNTLTDLFDDPQLRFRGYFVSLPVVGTDRSGLSPGAPYRLSATPWQIYRSAPAHGEHNEAVFQELGINGNRLRELKGLGIV